MIRRLTLSALAASLFAFAAPSNASAAVSCNLAGGVLTVNVTGAGTQTAGLRMENGGTEIGVYNTTDFSSGQQNCGTTPTQANTNTIAVADIEPSSTNPTLLNVSLAGGQFVNTDATGEGAGTKEMEITYDGGEETDDDILLDGASSGGDNWRMGELVAGHGFQLDDSESGTVDVDDLVASNVEKLQLGINGNPGDDIIDARGGSGFTGAATFASGVQQLVGGSGDDHIFAGDGNSWRVEGDDGADELIGGPGADLIQLSFGIEPDTADGNGGIDNCSYLNHNAPVHVDLRVTGPQDTGGAGIDTLSDCESLSGGPQSDVLIGTNGPNNLQGGENTPGQTGADILIGLGGNDTIAGSLGSDTVSYTQGSTGPVTVDLGNAGAQNTGGAGTDTITTTENLIGSEFSDTLTGDGGPNQVDVYDGILDTVDCAGSADVAIADELGVDSLANCETVDHAPKVSVGAPPADGAVLDDPTLAYPLSADEAASFQVSVDGAGFVACAASCEPPPLADGAHTLAFRAVDADENLHPGLNPVTRSVTIATGQSPDTDPPETKLKKPKVKGDDVTLKFSSDEAGSTFRCKLDRRKLKTCRSPRKYKNLDEGKHKVTVLATDAAGNVDPSPAKRKFKVEPA